MCECLSKTIKPTGTQKKNKKKKKKKKNKHGVSLLDKRVDVFHSVFQRCTGRCAAWDGHFIELGGDLALHLMCHTLQQGQFLLKLIANAAVLAQRLLCASELVFHCADFGANLLGLLEQIAQNGLSLWSSTAFNRKLTHPVHTHTYTPYTHNVENAHLGCTAESPRRRHPRLPDCEQSPIRVREQWKKASVSSLSVAQLSIVKCAQFHRSRIRFFYFFHFIITGLSAFCWLSVALCDDDGRPSTLSAVRLRESDASCSSALRCMVFGQRD